MVASSPKGYRNVFAAVLHKPGRSEQRGLDGARSVVGAIALNRDDENGNGPTNVRPATSPGRALEVLAGNGARPHRDTCARHRIRARDRGAAEAVS
jgi:hypothetical protein